MLSRPAAYWSYRARGLGPLLRAPISLRASCVEVRGRQCRREGMRRQPCRALLVVLGEQQASTRVGFAAYCLAATRTRTPPAHLNRCHDFLPSIIVGLRAELLSRDSLRPTRTF
jgi:hypothetical protein